MTFATAVTQSIPEYAPDTEPIKVAIMLAEQSLVILSECVISASQRNGPRRTLTQYVLDLFTEDENYDNEEALDLSETAAARFNFTIDHAMLTFSVVVDVWGTGEYAPKNVKPVRVTSIYQTTQTKGSLVAAIPRCREGSASAHRRILIAALGEPQPRAVADAPLYVVDRVTQMKAIRYAEYQKAIADERRRIAEQYGAKYIAVPPPIPASLDAAHEQLYLQARREKAMAELVGEITADEEE
jgi:hypothetical protein